MIRAIVYSIVAVIVFVAASMAWVASQDAQDIELLFGWTVIIGLFAVAPVFFTIGLVHYYWRNPRKPRWDSELQE